MSKNIVLLSDGTGNSSSKIFKTNVWRLFQALDLTDPNKQVAFTTMAWERRRSSGWAALAVSSGSGLKRNVMDIYSLLLPQLCGGRPAFMASASAAAPSRSASSPGSSRASGLVPYDGNEAIWHAMRSRLPIANTASGELQDYRRQLLSNRYAICAICDQPRYFPQTDHRAIRKRPALLSPSTSSTSSASGIPSMPMAARSRKLRARSTTGIWPLSMPDQFMNAQGRTGHAMRWRWRTSATRFARCSGTIAMCVAVKANECYSVDFDPLRCGKAADRRAHIGELAR